jgi:hypothetical protein
MCQIVSGMEEMMSYDEIRESYIEITGIDLTNGNVHADRD